MGGAVQRVGRQLLLCVPSSSVGKALSLSHGAVLSIADTAPQAPVPVPAAYVSAAQQVCMRQVALGGYRLAAALNGALEKVRGHAAALRGARSHRRTGRAAFGDRN